MITLLPASSAASAKPVPEGFKVTSLQLEEFVKSLADKHPGSPKLFIDCTSSQAVADLYPTLLKSGISIVTPNKKAFSAAQPLFSAIQEAKSKKALVYQESTVGAGLPIISTLNDLVATGDKVVKIEGVLSGTLSYIFNEFSKPVKGAKAPTFSSVVSIAKEQGYTVSSRCMSRLTMSMKANKIAFVMLYRNLTQQMTYLAPMSLESYAYYPA